MMSARSFGNYDLAAALADLIDNSIKAHASFIEISCLFNAGDPVVTITDDGEGMSPSELMDAMRPASSNPSKERSPDDLGRFGWGMKSASFSQCKKLTVISSRNSEMSGAVWDLDDLDEWKMGVLNPSEIYGIDHGLSPDSSGTSVIWTHTDRLSEGGSLSNAEFNELIAQTSEQLALVFHRFIEGIAGSRNRLSISVNGNRLDAYDPFYRKHEATQVLEIEPLLMEGTTILIQPYVLPHFSKLKPHEHERLGGEEGFLRNQGFYVYRNNRLIIYGTWFRLAKFGELSQLVRISVDIPNSLDDLWKITVDKSDAQLPAALKARLRQIIAGLRKKSGQTYRRRGGRIDHPTAKPVWKRYSRNNEIRYELNREHPVLEELLQSTDQDTRLLVMAALRQIEQNFPVTAFADDSLTRGEDIGQSILSPKELEDQLAIIAPRMLSRSGGDFRKCLEMILNTEPFEAHQDFVELKLKEWGWKFK